MNPTEILRQAVEAVEEAHFPEDLRVVAFTKALDLLATPGGSATGARSMTAAGALPVRTATEEGSSLDRIALKLQTPLPAKVEGVFISKKISLKSS